MTSQALTQAERDDEAWRDDNAIKCHDLALGVIAGELSLSRKALRKIAATIPGTVFFSNDAIHAELIQRVAIAEAALAAIEALKGRG